MIHANSKQFRDRNRLPQLQYLFLKDYPYDVDTNRMFSFLFFFYKRTEKVLGDQEQNQALNGKIRIRYKWK